MGLLICQYLPSRVAKLMGSLQRCEARTLNRTVPSRLATAHTALVAVAWQERVLVKMD